MTLKPFRAPTFRKPDISDLSSPSYTPVSGGKRRKLSPDHDERPKLQTSPLRTTSLSTSERKPLVSLRNPPSPVKTSLEESSSKKYYSILWRKVTAKKNKTWDDDGVLSVNAGQVAAYSRKGQKLGAVTRDSPLEVDDLFSVNGKDIQIEAEIKYDEFCRAIGKDDGSSTVDDTTPKPLVKTTSSSKEQRKPAGNSLQEQMRQQIEKQRKTATKSSSSKPAVQTSRNAAFKQPLKGSQPVVQLSNEIPTPRHDPSAPNALVFKRPKRAPAGKQIVDVVLDPLISKHLRPHQREGVEFLYECVMDLRNFGGQGCILADDMGLGKTLQTIALIWTLLKQNPIYKEEPVIKKVLIVCPVTLVQNWIREFRKWLGRDRLGVMCFEDKNTGRRLSMFDGKNFKVMVVGYERLRTIAEDLNRGSSIDLIVCDEGHRLKTLQNKSAKAIETLNTPRRIILSGTPIQNDLNEFYAMVNFVNDGVLGSSKAFIRDFEKPIMKSRQPNASTDDVEKGEAASNELLETTSPFILRRTADVVSKYLPSKTEYVLFCQPTPEQARIYREVLKTSMFKSALGSQETALQMITILKKLCNSPYLLRPQQGSDEATPSNSLQTLNEMLPRELSRSFINPHASKIRLLDLLLQQIRSTTNDKVVLVSNYTATLNLMENLLSSSGLSFRRLDGSVPNGKRQALVDEFNRATPTTCFAFLLSAKAGGQGINLIGGNRLVLFDVDWNPATDDQAMARIHREGQKKQCKIYRFLVKGGLEERIWQRQCVKRALAESIIESKNPAKAKNIQAKAAFTIDELKDLFRLDEDDGLRTHDLIGCKCNGKGHLSHEENTECEDENMIHDISDIEPGADEEEDQPVRTFSFTRASEVTEQDLEEQEKSISTGSSPRKPAAKQKGRSDDGMHELLTYTHIDTSKIPTLYENKVNDTQELDALEDAIDDNCLAHVLKQGTDVVSANVAYVFMKKSKIGGLDAVIDDTSLDSLEVRSTAA